MALPAELRKKIASESEGHVDGRSSLGLVHELAEPLTAVTNYLEAALCLHDNEPRSAPTKLREALERSLAEISRADDLLHRLRTLLHSADPGVDR
jgi:two-component system, LuxR family, sensor kinase FixL